MTKMNGNFPGTQKITKPKPATVSSIVLTGEAMKQAIRFRGLNEEFQKRHQALQKEFQERLAVLQKAMEKSAAEVWGVIAKEVGIEDPEQAMSSGAWAIDAQYLEHGHVFLRRNAEPGASTAGPVTDSVIR